MNMDRVFLYRFGNALIPNSHRRNSSSKISLVVTQVGVTAAKKVAKHLSSHVDGELLILSASELRGRIEKVDPNSLFTRDVAVSVYVVNSRPSEATPLPPVLIHYLFNLNLDRVLSIGPDFAIAPYARPSMGLPRILYVSPGSIYPLNLGSHQRMFNTLQGLIDAGFDITVLHQKQRPEKEEITVAALSLAAVDVHSYSGKKGKLRGGVARRRRVYEVVRQLGRHNVGSPHPPTFAELCQQRSSFWLRKEIDILRSEREFSALWVNYAWMMGKVDRKLRQMFPTIICDTHDVQFYRNEKKAPLLERWLLSEKYDRQHELKQLSKADVVLAISDRDGLLLAEALPTVKVMTVVPTFNAMFKPAAPRNPYIPLVFGFIGTKMAANVDALCYVLKEWWPAIHSYSPESQFLVAGSVGQSPEVASYAWMYEEVKLLGFVDDLAKFYADIDLLLSPVLVRGGLNFKNIEAVTAGKHVVTNEAGLAAMQPINLPAVQDVAEVMQHIKRIETDAEYDLSLRRAAQNAALRRFANAKEMEAIRDIILARSSVMENV